MLVRHTTKSQYYETNNNEFRRNLEFLKEKKKDYEK